MEKLSLKARPNFSEKTLENVCFNEGLFLKDKRAYLFFKAIADKIFSFLVILFIFPWVFPIIALSIKLSSKGSVLFKQKRIGYKNKVFVCYKFRTMYVNKFADIRQARRNDSRITGVGRFLRKSGLDELPQFINILAGQMSIIGPRPHMIHDHNKFSAIVPRYGFRNLVRPGISGMAQIKGFRGRAGSTDRIFGRYLWDIYYAKNISFITDLKILFETIKVTLRSCLLKNKQIISHPAQPSLSKLLY